MRLWISLLGVGIFPAGVCLSLFLLPPNFKDREPGSPSHKRHGGVYAHTYPSISYQNALGHGIRKFHVPRLTAMNYVNLKHRR